MASSWPRLDVTEDRQTQVGVLGAHFLWIEIERCILHAPFKMCSGPFMSVISSPGLIMIWLQIETSVCAWCMVHGAWCMVHGAWCMCHMFDKAKSIGLPFSIFIEIPLTYHPNQENLLELSPRFHMEI